MLDITCGGQSIKKKKCKKEYSEKKVICTSRLFNEMKSQALEEAKKSELNSKRQQKSPYAAKLQRVAVWDSSKINL